MRTYNPYTIIACYLQYFKERETEYYTAEKLKSCPSGIS